MSSHDDTAESGVPDADEGRAPRRSLAELGWSPHFAALTTDDPVAEDLLARVSDVHRDELRVLTTHGDLRVAPPATPPDGGIAVGDWVRLAPDRARVAACLERRSVLRRQSRGERATEQAIAANVDTLFVVTSCNADFNPARLERYLALAASADVLPVVVLTKADLVDDVDTYRRTAERLSPIVTATSLDARSTEALDALRPWLGPGETAALVGSSGVGKSTILNGLTGGDAPTRGIREDDAKGRHTTTARSLRRTRHGGWIVDTPGMRALGLTDASEGIEQVFGDLVELAAQCRFHDCAHESEPGCAVRAAIEDGRVEPERLERWRKLEREDRHYTRSVAEARDDARRFARGVRSAMSRKRRERDG